MQAGLDFFKAYNDNYGHLSGDECLKEIAKVLDASVNRSMDLVARFGGEEFVILLPETESHQAAHIAEKCLGDIVSSGIPHEYSSVSNVVTVSIGVSSKSPANSELSASLVDAADKLLYKAKNNGRNRFECD